MSPPDVNSAFPWRAFFVSQEVISLKNIKTPSCARCLLLYHNSVFNGTNAWTFSMICRILTGFFQPSVSTPLLQSIPNGVKEAMLSVHYPAAFRLQETMASELLRPVRSDCGQRDASVGFVLCQLFNFFQRHHHVLLLFCLSARKRKGRILKIKIPSRTDFI